jgi:hypothetical protein
MNVLPPFKLPVFLLFPSSHRFAIFNKDYNLEASRRAELLIMHVPWDKKKIFFHFYYYFNMSTLSPLSGHQKTPKISILLLEKKNSTEKD